MEWGPNTETATRKYMAHALSFAEEAPRAIYELAVTEVSNGLLVGGIGLHVSDAQAMLMSHGLAVYQVLAAQICTKELNRAQDGVEWSQHPVKKGKLSADTIQLFVNISMLSRRLE